MRKMMMLAAVSLMMAPVYAHANIGAFDKEMARAWNSENKRGSNVLLALESEKKGIPSGCKHIESSILGGKKPIKITCMNDLGKPVPGSKPVVKPVNPRKPIQNGDPGTKG